MNVANTAYTFVLTCIWAYLLYTTGYDAGKAAR